MKILTVCNHGNIRSVGLAYILKTLFKHEAIAIGVEDTTIKTQQMLFDWADKIIILTEDLKIDNPKAIYFDVGKDIWFDAKHQGLVHKLYKELSKHPELFDNK